MNQEKISLAYDGSGIMVDRTFIVGGSFITTRPSKGIEIILNIAHDARIAVTTSDSERGNAAEIRSYFGDRIITSHRKLRRSAPIFIADQYRLILEEKDREKVTITVESTHPLTIEHILSNVSFGVALRSQRDRLA